MQATQQPSITRSTRPHYPLLDGLRGVAAIAVLVFHFMELAEPDYTKNFIAHGYLAVDFFFCLSGFVVAYAYDGRLEQMGVGTFLKLRLIRLQPLVVVGSVIGLISFLVDPYRNFYQTMGFGKTVWLFVTSCLMIPNPVLPQRYNNIFHLNPPTWSLLWEYVASLVYALVLVKLANRWVWLLTGLAAIALCYTGVLFKNIGVGWSGETFIGGGARVAFSFLMGVLIYRSGWLIPTRLGFLPIAVLLLALLLVPFRDGLNLVTEPLVVIIGFPVLLAMGATTSLSARWQSICTWLGELSYPLYMVHYPFIWVLLSYMEVHKPTPTQLALIMPLMGLGLLVFAYGVLVYVDRPIRTYLTKRFVPQRKKAVQ
ncbi:acyltransferase family protein [Fibrella aestuarina]|uniref:acyltransferase family protein n=1 Tax=Fibrella aestuarina TaxID=651143 RepID=UPI000686A1F7|nr:acyltransferase [Fibrella aestuarina]